MAEQKLIFSATTPDGLDASKTISNFNPDASNAQLAQLGQKLIAFTDNTYGKTDRVIKYNCDTEGGGSKLTPTFTLAKTTDTAANVKAATYPPQNVVLSYSIDFTYDGDGIVSAYCTDGNIGATVINTSNMQRFVVCSYMPAADLNINNTATFTFTASETDTYKAATATFTITV